MAQSNLVNTIAKVNAGGSYLRFRDTPGLSGKILGDLNDGTEVLITDVVNDVWARIAIKVGDAPLLVEGTNNQQYGYMHINYLKFKTPAPLPVTPKQRYPIYGLNGITSTNEMEAAAKAGVKAFVVINNAEFANKLADVYGCMVIFRSLWLNGIDTPRRASEELLEPRISKNVWGVVGDNEWEHFGNGKRDIKNHSEWDTTLANIIKSQNPNKHYLAYTAPMGTLDTTNDQETCDLMAQYYAPGYNNRTYDFDYHMYTPKPLLMSQRLEDLIYYELRWRTWFTKCGFDPNIKGVYCTEWGFDVQGSGGFSAFDKDDTFVAQYYREHMQIMGEPFMVNGKLYESPIVAGFTFQLGPHPKWLSYNMQRYLPMLIQNKLVTLRLN